MYLFSRRLPEMKKEIGALVILVQNEIKTKKKGKMILKEIPKSKKNNGV